LNNGKAVCHEAARAPDAMARARGRLLAPETMSEMLTARGLKFVAFSSGSTGQALLLNRKCSAVKSPLKRRLRRRKTHANPNDITRRSSAASAIFQNSKEEDKALEWTERVLREYVLKDLKPDWFSMAQEPDGQQHSHGAGSPEGMAGIKRSDHSIGVALENAETLASWIPPT